MDWKMIEDAPKETEVLLYVPPGKIRVGIQDKDGKWWGPNYWIRLLPTHWAPLPDIPERR